MGCDLDDWLAYTTEREVKIRHRWVGAVYYITLLTILGYVFGYEVIYNKGYASFQSLTGTVRATVRAATGLRPLQALPYCSNPHGRPIASANPLPCVSWDTTLTSQSSPGALLVGTRVTRSTQWRNASCDELDYGCAPWVTNTTPTSVYVGDVESATILIQHSVSARALIGLGASSLDSFSSKRPAAVLTGWNGQRVTTLPCGTPAAAGTACGSRAVGDLLTVGQLLEAAGVELDDKAKTKDANGTNLETIRSAGLTLLLTVEYTAGLGNDGYSYTVNKSALEDKATFFGAFASAFDTKPGLHREIYDVHGLQLLFTMSGGLMAFDWTVLLLTLVTGLALVSAARTVANLFVLYVAPRRADYRLFVQTATPDFHPDSAEGERLLGEMLTRKRLKHSQQYVIPLSDSPVNTMPQPLLAACSTTAGGAEGRAAGQV